MWCGVVWRGRVLAIEAVEAVEASGGEAVTQWGDAVSWQRRSEALG